DVFKNERFSTQIAGRVLVKLLVTMRSRRFADAVSDGGNFENGGDVSFYSREFAFFFKVGKDILKCGHAHEDRTKAPGSLSGGFASTDSNTVKNHTRRRRRARSGAITTSDSAVGSGTAIGTVSTVAE